jgi:hypothetical protein
MPRFAAVWGNRKGKFIDVAKSVCCAGGFGLPTAVSVSAMSNSLSRRVMAWIFMSSTMFHQQQSALRITLLMD